MSFSNTENETALSRICVLLVVILAAAAARILAHPWNFTPVGAMALFSGAMLRDKRLAFGFPLAAMLVGDCVIGFHLLMPVVYASFLLSVMIGRWLRHGRTAGRVAGATLAGAFQFFLITNFAVWAVSRLYPKTGAGLLACYIAGIPFFRNALAGDAVYVAMLFGALALAEWRYPTLREAPIAAHR